MTSSYSGYLFMVLVAYASFCGLALKDIGETLFRTFLILKGRPVERALKAKSHSLISVSWPTIPLFFVCLLLINFPITSGLLHPLVNSFFTFLSVAYLARPFLIFGAQQVREARQTWRLRREGFPAIKKVFPARSTLALASIGLLFSTGSLNSESIWPFTVPAAMILLVSCVVQDWRRVMATLPQSHPVTKLTQEIASSFGSQPPRIILSSSSLVPSPCRVNSWGDIFVSPDYLLKYSYKEQAVLLIRAIFLTQLIEYRFWQCFGFLYLGFVFMALTQKSLFLLLGFNLGVAILLGGLFAFVLCLARRQYREKA